MWPALRMLVLGWRFSDLQVPMNLVKMEILTQWVQMRMVPLDLRLPSEQHRPRTVLSDIEPLAARGCFNVNLNLN